MHFKETQFPLRLVCEDSSEVNIGNNRDLVWPYLEDAAESEATKWVAGATLYSLQGVHPAGRGWGWQRAVWLGFSASHGSVCEDSSICRILVIASTGEEMIERPIPKVRLLLAGRVDVAGAQVGIIFTGSMWTPLNPSGPWRHLTAEILPLGVSGSNRGGSWRDGEGVWVYEVVLVWVWAEKL